MKPRFVRSVLSEMPYLISARDSGDFSAAEALADIEYAFRAAGLTKRARHALIQYHAYDMTGEMIAATTGTTKQAVSNMVRRSEARMQTVFDEWDKLEGVERQ